MDVTTLNKFGEVIGKEIIPSQLVESAQVVYASWRKTTTGILFINGRLFTKTEKGWRREMFWGTRITEDLPDEIYFCPASAGSKREEKYFTLPFKVTVNDMSLEKR